MKKLMFFLAFSMGIVSLSKAQGGRNMGTPEERAQKNTDALVSKLKLTDDQKSKIYTINLDQAKKVDSLFKAPGDMQEKRPAMMALRQTSDTNIKAVLTDDQKKEYDSWLEERRSQMRNGGGRPQGNQ
ncbi:hypothetical protein GS399_06645 [Pedobacter sp. HMF7647]|uniref:DUF4890 domain-containing protein n=1 Tax=Hufsiella arboris TaxID=2695275 RepID=A0A7K1Y7V2_9SPHI|nr:hypothetical protein [Hufsiella arboris]MXV50646.1 hypothetical protein [Hufsiella arboris]